MTASVKQSEKMLDSSKNEKKLLENVSDEPIRMYDKQHTVVERRVKKPVKYVASHLFGMAMCVSRAFRRWRLREMSELDYFKKDLRRN